MAVVAYSQETSSFTVQRTSIETFRAYGLAEAAVLENRSGHDGALTPATRAWLEARITAGIGEPTIAWRKIPLITYQEQFLTAAGPMTSWFDRARAMERLPGVASASTFPRRVLT